MCVQRLQSCVSMMAHENQTPFLKLLPTPYEDDEHPVDNAFLACTAYRARTRQNSTLVTNTLKRNFLGLIKAALSFKVFEDHLQVIQALLLYQIMFFFGDDDDLRQLAETHAKAVQTSVDIFQHRLISKLRKLPQSMTLDPPAIQYGIWLLLESARRTIFAHLFIKCIYGQYKNGYCEYVPYLAPLPVTTAGDLWEAKSEDDWWQLVLRRDRPIKSSVMAYDEAVNMWYENGQSNMDDFHVMIYGACKDILR